MKRLTCEMCGSTDLVKDGGVFVCQVCGCKYSIEEARKMMVEGTVEVTGTVKVDNSAAIANYLKMAQNAMDADNNEEAENYANKIIELDPQHSEAWRIKGEAAGWQSTAAKPRLSDSVSAWLNAITYAKEEDKPSLREDIAGKYTRLMLAMISLRTGNFGKIQSEENKKSTKSSIEDGISMMNMLLAQGGVSFNRGYTYNRIAKMVNEGAVAGYKDAKDDFGPEHHNMSKWQWERFYGSCDQCLAMLEIALEYVRDESLAKTICDNLITIGETARDSCSWKFNVNSWNADNYDRDYSFTEEAKKIRTKNIDGWKEKKKKFNTGRVDRVQKALQSGRVDEEEARGRAKYWEEHADEKLALEAEKKELQAKTNALKSRLTKLPISAQIAETENKISGLEQQKSSLGIFKGKEKKALQDQIDQLKVLVEQQKAEETKAKKPYFAHIKSFEDRVTEINKEFTKSRGRISTEESIAIPNAIVDGKFAITPEQFTEYLSKVIPEPYFLDTLSIASTSIMGNRLGLGTQYQVIIKDSSKKNKDGKPENSGFVVLFQADSPSDLIQSVCLECGSDITEELAKGWCQFGTYLLQLLSADTTKTEAENAISKMILSDSGSLYGFGELRAEYANYHYDLLGLLTCTQHCILIRTQK